MKWIPSTTTLVVLLVFATLAAALVALLLPLPAWAKVMMTVIVDVNVGMLVVTGLVWWRQGSR